MARPLRIEFPGAWYHVINRGAGKRDVFLLPSHRWTFLRLLGEITAVFGVEIHAYCLMGNHYHLLMCTPEAGLSRAMRHLNGVYTQRFNRRVGTDGPLFRGRYKSLLVDADSYMTGVSRYIHLNPVSADLAKKPERYQWSSYRAYLGRERGPEWLHVSRVLGQFGPGDARQRYREFVESGVDKTLTRFYERSRWEPVLGSKSFREEVDRRVCLHDQDREVPDRNRVRARPSLGAICRAVSTAFGISRQDLLENTHSRNPVYGAARGTVVYLARRAGGHAMSSIARASGYRSYSGASTAMRRLASAMESDPAIRRRVLLARRLLSEGET